MGMLRSFLALQPCVQTDGERCVLTASGCTASHVDKTLLLLGLEKHCAIVVHTLISQNVLQSVDTQTRQLSTKACRMLET